MPSKKFFDISPRKKEKPLATKKKVASVSPKKVTKEKPAPPLKRGKKPYGYKIILVTLFLFVFLAALSLTLFSRAEIEVRPKTKDISFEEEILASENYSEADLQEKIIPGVLLVREKSVSQTFSSSGVSEESGKALGTIKVYNNYHLAQPLVATTRFVSADGKLFRSTEGITIPSGGEVDVEVEAAEPGPDYNIKATTFSIPGLLGSPRYTAVYGESFSPMKGGFLGEASRVTKEDIERAGEGLQKTLKSLIAKELREMAGQSFSFLEESIAFETIESSCSKEEGDIGKDFECSLKMKAKGLAFEKSILDAFARELIYQNIEQPDFLKEEATVVEPFVLKSDIEEKEALLEIRIKGKTFLETEFNFLKEGLAGKSLEEAQILLENHPSTETSRIKIFPFWVQKLPNNPERIEIKSNLE